MLIAHTGLPGLFRIEPGDARQGGVRRGNARRPLRLSGQLAPLRNGIDTWSISPVRLGCERSRVKPSAYREMERAGFSKEEMLEMIGIAAFWNLATTISIAVAAGLAEE